MPIASFGSKVFVVSHSKLNTFDNFSHSRAINTETIEVEGKKSSTYIKGSELETISFDIKLFAGLNDIPKEIAEWDGILKGQKAQVFILGSKPVGDNKWLLKSIDQTESIIDSKGNYMQTKLAFKLEEWVRPGKPQKDAGTAAPGIPPSQADEKRRNPRVIESKNGIKQMEW